MMTQATEAKETGLYLEAYEQLRQRTASEVPSWLDRLRAEALEKFSELGFPAPTLEEWRYTNVAPIAKARFVPSWTIDGAEEAGRRWADRVYEEARSSVLVFVNGRFRSDLSSLAALPREAVVLGLADALRSEHQKMIGERLARGAAFDRQHFAALNTAFIADGAFVYLPRGVRVEAPIQLLFISDSGPVMSFPRVLVVAERESEATLIERYVGAADQPYFTDAVVEIYIDENAHLEHYKVQEEGLQGFHVATTWVELKRAARYHSTTVTLGAQLARHNIAAILTEEGGECRVDGLYMVDTGQHADTHSLIEHRAPRCTSFQLYKGILDGRSRGVFNGRIYVHREAQQTDAYQTNRNLMLSNEARVDTKPQLEIFADDVKCSHGATVGQLEEEELFYLRTRGLSFEKARNLLTYGFAEEVVEKIAVDSIREQLNEVILNRLHATALDVR